jgi:hypothetical protein
MAGIVPIADGFAQRRGLFSQSPAGLCDPARWLLYFAGASFSNGHFRNVSRVRPGDPTYEEED